MNLLQETMLRAECWLRQLSTIPPTAAYWTNGVFANDCRDAAEVIRTAKPFVDAADEGNACKATPTLYVKCIDGEFREYAAKHDTAPLAMEAGDAKTCPHCRRYDCKDSDTEGCSNSAGWAMGGKEEGY